MNAGMDEGLEEMDEQEGYP